MKIALVTDAWSPQTNGVVTTLSRTSQALADLGHAVTLMTPGELPSIPCPSYPEIRLSLFARRPVSDWLAEQAPDAVHIATEGPLGLAARRACLDLGWQFTSSYHTRFPEYLSARWPLPQEWSYAWLKRFHRSAARVMVGTRHLRRDLRRRGFRNLVLWSRGVDTGLFHPHDKVQLETPRPLLMYVGRVAVEKNIEDFLRLRRPGTKCVVGDGPARQALAARYPEVQFVGYLQGEALAARLAQADVLVFPSRTDTFGLVMLEAMACGVPVAAYPVTGPLDVVNHGITGWLDADLDRAIEEALQLDPARCRAHALGFRWEAATQQFLGHLVPARGPGARRLSLP